MRASESAESRAKDPIRHGPHRLSGGQGSRSLLDGRPAPRRWQVTAAAAVANSRVSRSTEPPSSDTTSAGGAKLRDPGQQRRLKRIAGADRVHHRDAGRFVFHRFVPAERAYRVRSVGDDHEIGRRVQPAPRDLLHFFRRIQMLQIFTADPDQVRECHHGLHAPPPFPHVRDDRGPHVRIHRNEPALPSRRQCGQSAGDRLHHQRVRTEVEPGDPVVDHGESPDT